MSEGLLFARERTQTMPGVDLVLKLSITIPALDGIFRDRGWTELDPQPRSVGERRPHAILWLRKIGEKDPVAVLLGAEVFHDPKIRRGAGEVERRKSVGVRRDRKIEGVGQVGHLQPLGHPAYSPKIRLDD